MPLGELNIATLAGPSVEPVFPENPATVVVTQSGPVGVIFRMALLPKSAT